LLPGRGGDGGARQNVVTPLVGVRRGMQEPFRQILVGVRRGTLEPLRHIMVGATLRKLQPFRHIIRPLHMLRSSPGAFHTKVTAPLVCSIAVATTAFLIATELLMITHLNQVLVVTILGKQVRAALE